MTPELEQRVRDKCLNCKVPPTSKVSTKYRTIYLCDECTSEATFWLDELGVDYEKEELKLDE